MALYRSPDYHTGLSQLACRFQRQFNIDFQDGGHLGFLIRTILATFHRPHLDTSNKVSSQLPFWFRRKSLK